MPNEPRGFFFRPATEPPKTQHRELPAAFIYALFMVCLAALLFGVSTFAWFVFRLWQDLPIVSQMQAIEQPLASKVLDQEGRLVHEFSTERRIWVPIGKIPPDLQNAVIAIEDRRFYKHWGIDIRRILGAAVVDVVRGSSAQGGSTITAQLARNLYLTAKKSILRKIREALTACQLEASYTKREILELYLNQVYLGGGAWGVEAASNQYFSKHVNDLDRNECATLAGIIQLPEKYRPDKPANLQRITARRNIVLRAMHDMGFIKTHELRSLSALPVPSNPRMEKPSESNYFLEMVRKYVRDKYGDDELYTGGLTIHTTLDREAQIAAEAAAEKQIASLQRRLNRIFLDSTKAFQKYRIPRDTFLAHFDSLYALDAEQWERLPDSMKLRQAQIAVVAIDAADGGIKMLIGGRNFEESKFNRVTMGLRQPGSAFKPFVYTAAIERGYSPASVVLDQPITLQTPEGEWRPENYDHVFNGPITVRRAVGLSVNIVAIQVLMDIGPKTVVECARRMGLTSQSIQPVPSLAIGSCEATPMEIVSAYQIFANKGVAQKPWFIEKIINKNGRVIDQNTPEARVVLTPQTAFLMTSLLQTVVCCGTASMIPSLGFNRPAAGKTGTTNDYSDAWFVGFSPQIVCCVWVGTDERRSLGAGVTGSIGAVPVWVTVMSALHRNLPVRYFKVPPGIKSMNLCNESHLIATKSCPKAKPDFFLKEAVIDTCTLHGKGRVADRTRIDRFGPDSRPVVRQDSLKKPKRKIQF
ncbi:MAG: PBP1A family penicillin-binding protein [Chitinispirillaceae bacterium]|nr:PBP1A family penicillin-binding protein [Chitinispirillaceae bacterium]